MASDKEDSEQDIPEMNIDRKYSKKKPIISESSDKVKRYGENKKRT